MFIDDTKEDAIIPFHKEIGSERSSDLPGVTQQVSHWQHRGFRTLTTQHPLCLSPALPKMGKDQRPLWGLLGGGGGGE